MILAGPEEAAQAVLFPTGNDMHVQVGDTLADSIIDRDKRAFGLHAMLDRASQHLGITEKWRDERRGKIFERLIMLPGNQQRVAGKKRAMVQKRERDVVFKNDVARHIMRDDLAELACRSMFHQLATGPSPRLSEAMMVSLRSSEARTADPME